MKALIDHIVPSQTKHTIGYKDFIVTPSSSQPNIQVRVARQHVNTSSHAVVDLAQCVTESILIVFDVFLNIYSHFTISTSQCSQNHQERRSRQ